MINHVQQPHLETSSLKLHECELVITIYDGYETEGGVNSFLEESCGVRAFRVSIYRIFAKFNQQF